MPFDKALAAELGREKRYGDRLRNDPREFAEKILGVKLWARQADVLSGAAKTQRLAIRSGHGTGKTFLLAVLALWYTITRPGTITLATANTWEQVRGQLWQEMTRLYSRAVVPLGGEFQKTQWILGPQWFLKIFSPDNPDAAQGYHAKNILQIVDEASGLLPEMLEAFEGNMSGAGSRLVLSGNPLRPSGPFFDAFHGPGADNWTKAHISSLEAAANTDTPGLTSQEWIDARRTEWGEGSPAWKARVLGEFPDQGDDTLIPLSFVDYAESIELALRGDLVLGVDIARFGSDATVFIARDDCGVRHVEEHRGWDTMQTCGRLKALAVELKIPSDRIYVDDAGLGGGVTDRLREMDFAIVPVNFGSGAQDTERFANTRAECYWLLREHLQKKEFSLHDAGSAVGGQLTSINYGYTSKGQIKLEPKEDVKKRIGRSPDHADALALTFARPTGPMEVFML